jgi:quercetin dioxygenase-like cupin family protein
MRLHDDLSAPVLVHGGRLAWVPSPSAGVERRMLYRVGEERARATSIVRYAPGSSFPTHVHTGGEEFFVLEGVFRDERGEYPKGTYVRNPPGSAHAPSAPGGATLFVRLWQFRRQERARSVVFPGGGVPSTPRPGAARAACLFADEAEAIHRENWQPGAVVPVDNPRGLELLVLEGKLEARGEQLAPQAWLRLPAGVPLEATVGPSGARVWLRLGALAHADVCPL